MKKYCHIVSKHIKYIGESKIIGIVGACFAFGYTASWARCDTPTIVVHV